MNVINLTVKFHNGFLKTTKQDFLKVYFYSLHSRC